MTHLFICREYPPAAYPPGGIGTYVQHITHRLARAGEMVHVIAHRWDGAPNAREVSNDGRLVVHRVALDEALTGRPARVQMMSPETAASIARGLLVSSFPSQAFAWQAARLAERLVESEGIDVIEAQEWEAPLYYFQLRRALNLGPARRPPCIVHIHSPTESIFAANEWDTTVADYRPATLLEAYSIAAADAILCPSRFVADQVMARYQVDPQIVTVIPYPLGEAARVDRSQAVWTDGSICHVGRLEPRKGVLEWIEAASLIEPAYPNLRLDFVGGDTPLRVTGGGSVKAAMLARAPRSLRRRLHFHGNRDRAGVVQVLSTASAAVVPSRWENFPYSCIEAMASGLPVIASPNGGMTEMVVDGESGWIAPDATPAGLRVALRRALDTPPSIRARMGEAAENTIRQLCDADSVVRRHLETKAAVVRAGAVRSSAASGRPFRGETSAVPNVESPHEHRGVGVVVTAASGIDAEACLASLRGQEEPPAAVQVIAETEAPSGAGIDTSTVLAIVFLDGRARLDPACLAICAAAFTRDPLLGIMSSWIRETAPGNRIHIPPCAPVPHVWTADQIAPYVAVRAAAYESAVRTLESSSGSPSRRSVFDQVARMGWTAVTYPAVLASIALTAQDPAAQPNRMRYSPMARAVQRLHMPILQWLRECSPEDRRELLRDGFSTPLRSTRWLTARALRFLRTPAASGSAETF